MPLNLAYLQELSIAPEESIVSDHNAILYALSIGLARDPLNEQELRFVHEDRLVAFPTLPLVTGLSQTWTSDPRTGITWSKVVHGAEHLSITRALPVGTPLRSHTRIVEVLDKGSRGAIIVIERSIFEVQSGSHIATAKSTVVCRADGGFGGPSKPSHRFLTVPSREPDCVQCIEIEANAALLYRLNQDRNPLHIDPEAARAAGFARPILHGLATFGFSAVAAYRLWPNRRLLSIRARFAKPVYPGEMLEMDLWDEKEGAAFRVRATQRAINVLEDGWLTYA